MGIRNVAIWRKPLEKYTVFSCIIAAVIVFVYARTSGNGLRMMAGLSLPLILFGAYRAYQYFRHVLRQAQLFQHPKCMETYEKIFDLVDSQEDEDAIFIGYGFEWEQSHSQTLREICSRDLDEIKPPKFALNLRKSLGKVNPRPMHGSAYLHGIGYHEEKPIFVNAEDLGAHSYIGATTGSGKSQFFQVLIPQMIRRGEAVIILDPKGDDNVKDTCYSILKSMGKEHKFHYFSPSNYINSVRINPFKSFTRSSQLADRLSSILQGGGDSEIYKQFVNQHLAVLNDSILYCGESPSLKSLKRYCSGGLDSLVARVFTTFFKNNETRYPSWQNESETFERRMKQSDSDPSQVKAQALLQYYTNNVPVETQEDVIKSLIDIYKKERSHYEKLIMSLMPLLQKLATGYVGDLLSPDYDNPEDERPITDFETICAKGDVVYVNLESLADGASGSAMGALFLSDLTSAAAARYLFDNKDVAVNLFVDEAAELVNDPFVQALNKSRGAKFRIFACSQTTSDFTVRMGDVANTMMILGNTNNKFYGRLRDIETGRTACEELGMTKITSMDESMATTGNPAGEEMDYGGGYGKSKSGEFSSKVEPDQFLRLPDLEYFGSLLDGRIVKFRLPFIPTTHKYDLEEHVYRTPV